MVGTCELLICS